MELHVLVDLQRDLGLAVRTEFDVRDRADPHAGHAYGRLVVETSHGVEDGLDRPGLVPLTEGDVLDLQNEVPEDRKDYQHEDAEFRCRAHFKTPI